jgi:hypothetical protein
MILKRLAPLLIAACASPALCQVNFEYQYGGADPGAAGGSYSPELSHAFGGSPSGTFGGSGSAVLLGSWQAQLAQEQQHAQALAQRWARLGQTQREESPQTFLEKYNQKQRAAAKAATTWHDPAFQTSIMEWPWIKSNPSDWDRLDYALSVARWAEEIQPTKTFSPPKGLNETQAELKLLDALAALRDVKDTEGSKMADEQKEEMDSPVVTMIKDTAKDKAIEWAIRKLISEAAEKAFSWYGNVKSAIKPIVAADDTILMRNALQRQIESQLDAYQRKRDLANGVLRLSQPSYVQILIESGWGTNQNAPTMNRLD